jgi:hypothetical protein
MDKKESQFRFTISKPKRAAFKDESYGDVYITQKAPCVISRFTVNFDQNDAIKMELAKANTKLRMIEDLLNGDWQYETD